MKSPHHPAHFHPAQSERKKGVLDDHDLTRDGPYGPYFNLLCIAEVEGVRPVSFNSSRVLPWSLENGTRGRRECARNDSRSKRLRDDRLTRGRGHLGNALLVL